ncbi:MAG: hypothetical protein AAFO72_01605 [Pseudomonadota bacterium]
MRDITDYFQNLTAATTFKDEEDGAVSVDWVVLTAAIVGVAAAAGSTVKDGVETASGTISSAVSSKAVNNGN